jgi:hypothetical protein
MMGNWGGAEGVCGSCLVSSFQKENDEDDGDGDKDDDEGRGHLFPDIPTIIPR